MNKRVLIRELRKEALQLQARRCRLALKDDLAALAEPFSLLSGVGTTSPGRWLSFARGALSLLPGRWGSARWGSAVSLGLIAWRLIRRVLGKKKADASK